MSIVTHSPPLCVFFVEYMCFIVYMFADSLWEHQVCVVTIVLYDDVHMTFDGTINLYDFRNC